MSRRDDLLHLSPEALTQIANAGLVKRALRELAADYRPRITVDEAGLLDAHYEHGLNVWDWAAGALIATEAGARVHLPGADGRGATVVAAPGIADALFSRLRTLGALDGLPDGPA